MTITYTHGQTEITADLDDWRWHGSDLLCPQCAEGAGCIEGDSAHEDCGPIDVGEAKAGIHPSVTPLTPESPWVCQYCYAPVAITAESDE